MKIAGGILLICLGMMSSCDTRCYSCTDAETGEVIQNELCTDDPFYSTAIRDDWRYSCNAGGGLVDEYKK